MKRYIIYCTESQTKKALELGAPIEVDFQFNSKTAIINKITYRVPTAEQMIGWLGEQGIWIHFCKPNQRPELFSFSVSVPNELFKRVFIGDEFASRKEATLAAISAALDYLIKNKR